MKIAAWTPECRVFAQFKELRWFIQSQAGKRRGATYSRSHAGCSQGGSLDSHTQDLSLKMGLQIFYKICNIL